MSLSSVFIVLCSVAFYCVALWFVALLCICDVLCCVVVLCSVVLQVVALHCIVMHLARSMLRQKNNKALRFLFLQSKPILNYLNSKFCFIDAT